MENGRGDVHVIQQPSRRNDYTAVVRVSDPRGGADAYRISAWWIDAGNGPGNARDRGPWDDRGRGRDGWEDERGRGRDDRVAFRWRGSVDGELEIRIRGERIDYRTISGRGTREVDAEVARNGIPRAVGELDVREWTARGDVFIVEQPSQRNGFTTVVRIRDPQPGYGFYDFSLTTRGGYARR
jgi:hypothetical protein